MHTVRCTERTLVALADDNDELRDLLSRALRQDGYEVFTAADGRALLEIVDAHAPDVVIVDFEMPELNGIEVLRALEADAFVSVILITGLPLFDLDDEAYALGALAVLSKPFETETLTRAMSQPRRVGPARRVPRRHAALVR